MYIKDPQMDLEGFDGTLRSLWILQEDILNTHCLPKDERYGKYTLAKLIHQLTLAHA